MLELVNQWARFAAALAVVMMVGCSPSTSTPIVMSDRDPVAAAINRALFQATKGVEISGLDRVDRVAEQELVVADCMRAQGFEYVPERAPTYLLSDDELRDLYDYAWTLEPESIEFRQEFGYGNSTLLAYTYVLFDIGTANSDIQLELDDAGRRAYELALAGPAGDGGCMQEAREQLPFAEPSDSDNFSALYSARRGATEQVAGSRVFVEAEQVWARCANAQGYDLESPLLLQKYLDSMLDEIMRLDLSALETVFDFSESSSLYHAEDLAAVQAAEIEMALALAPCDAAYGETINPLLDDAAREILEELGYSL